MVSIVEYINLLYIKRFAPAILICLHSAPFNKMKADAKKIILKDIAFIKKSIEILDANDSNFQW